MIKVQAVAYAERYDQSQVEGPQQRRGEKNTPAGMRWNIITYVRMYVHIQ